MNNLQQTIIERYTEKKFNSKDFTYRDYINLRKKLINKISKAEQTIDKTENQIQTIENIPKTSILSTNDYDNILSTTALASTATASLIALNAGCDISEVCASAFAGLTAGVFLGFANIEAFKKQPLTNAIRKTLVKHKERKVKKLTHKNELRNYTLYCFRQQEKDNKPTYEDFLKNIDENSDDLSL